MHIKIETTPVYVGLDVGNDFVGYAIIATVPDSPQMIIEVPGDGASVRKAMQALVDQHVIVDWRREHDGYVPAWIPPGPEALSAAPAHELGDTYPSEDLRAQGNFGAGITIGIVDTGCWTGHLCFDGVNLQGVDGAVDLQDSVGHGTACASILVGQLVTDSLGLVRDYGIARQARLLMGRGLDQPNGSGSEATIANKLRRLADRGCHIISLSLGGQPSSVMDAAAEYARSRGCLVVGAAGNTPNAILGSPARACDLVILAVDRNRNYASFTSGLNWSTNNRLSDYGVRIRSAAKDQREGSYEWDGTSAACPHVAGKAACLRGGGLSREEAIGYLLGHQVGPPPIGVPELAADYGSVPGEGGGGGSMDEVQTRLEAIQAECDRDGLRYWEIKPGDSPQDIEAFARDIQASLGIIWEHARIALDALPKAPDGPPVLQPPPVTLPPTEPPPAATVYGGSYPPSHDPAVDCYPGGSWGPHHNHVMRAPGPGRVEAYSFPTPLDSYAAMDAATQQRYTSLFTGYVCGMPVQPGPASAEPLQTMAVAVYWPDSPLQLPDGRTLRAVWGGHVHPQIPVGRVNTGDPIWTSWDTGIRFEARGIEARAAHVHCCGSRTGQLTPNGDVPGELVWQAMTGQPVERIQAPGPDSYQTGRFCAGRLRSDFEANGQPIPPMPTP